MLYTTVKSNEYRTFLLQLWRPTNCTGTLPSRSDNRDNISVVVGGEAQQVMQAHQKGKVERSKTAVDTAEGVGVRGEHQWTLDVFEETPILNFGITPSPREPTTTNKTGQAPSTANHCMP